MRETLQNSAGQIAIDRTVTIDVGGPETWIVADHCVTAKQTRVILNHLNGLTFREEMPRKTVYHRKGGKDFGCLSGEQMETARGMCKAQQGATIVDGYTLELWVNRKEGRVSVAIYDTDYIGMFSAGLRPVARVRADDDPSCDADSGSATISAAVLALARKMIEDAREGLTKGVITCQAGSPLAKRAKASKGEINGYRIEEVA